MQLLEVYTPSIKAYVRYRVLDVSEVDDFIEEHASLPREDYIHQVLMTVVGNFRPDVSVLVKSLSEKDSYRVLRSLYNGCVMLNPGLDVNEWLELTGATDGSKTLRPELEEDDFDDPVPVPKAKSAPKAKKIPITKAKFLGLESHLKENVVGQDEAAEIVVKYLKRSIAGINDEQRPLGVFLFAGASGVGKTELAKQLHSYLFGLENPIVRIDCGEYQHKHENQKLIGSPPGYVGYEDGGSLTNQVKNNPRTVVLLDEVEKAHPDIWSTFLRVFDEGEITDNSGKVISFRDTIIIMTTNLGNRESIADVLDGGIGFGADVDYNPNAASIPRERMTNLATKAIRKAFKPEFLNRIDKTVVFNHLSQDNLREIAEMELESVGRKLQKKGMTFSYHDDVVAQMIVKGSIVDGARGISKVRRECIEDIICDALLGSSRWPRGTAVELAWDDGYVATMKKPSAKRTKKAS